MLVHVHCPTDNKSIHTTVTPFQSDYKNTLQLSSQHAKGQLDVTSLTSLSAGGLAVYSWPGTIRNVSVPVSDDMRSHTSSIDLLRTSVPLISRISSPDVKCHKTVISAGSHTFDLYNKKRDTENH